MLKTLVRGLGSPPSSLPNANDRMDSPSDDGDDDDIDWEFLSSKTEGCQARDLTKLVKRSVVLYW